MVSSVCLFCVEVIVRVKFKSGRRPDPSAGASGERQRGGDEILEAVSGEADLDRRQEDALEGKAGLDQRRTHHGGGRHGGAFRHRGAACGV